MKKLLILMLAVVLGLFSLTACSNEETTTTENSAVEEQTEEVTETEETETETLVFPEELSVIVKDLMEATGTYAQTNLDGEWGDRYAALIEKAAENPDVNIMEDPEFTALREMVSPAMDEIGSLYAYVVAPDGETVDENGNPHYFITIDGSHEPDDFMYDLGWEWQFSQSTENGVASAAPSAWLEEEGVACWSTFAPIHDSEGNIVALLGIDTIVPEIMNHPEWIRDAAEWNGLLEWNGQL